MRTSSLATGAALAALFLLGCPRPPEERTGVACLEHTECGVCVAQPQCGWCMHEGVGSCIPNVGETEPGTPPQSCTDVGETWHFRIPDDPALPEGPPYCPRVASPDEAPASEGAGAEMEEAT